ncbi:cytochrome P450, partial [Streptomyces goshikiensis]
LNHSCLGAPPARREREASFGAGLAAGHPPLRLVREPQWREGYVIRGLEELLVEF